jgi:S-adenosylmethionine hydrolase
MALISLLTDYGYKDSYVSNLKARLWSKKANLNFLDISHEVEKFHIGQAGYFLKSNLDFFSKDDVHIIDVTHAYIPHKFILASSAKGIFIAPDNGILSILDIEFINLVELDLKPCGFFVLEYIVPILLEIFEGKAITEFGNSKSSLEKVYKNNVAIEDNQIIGSIIHVDSYGNLVTDLSKDIIELNRAGREIEVKVGRERINKISLNYKTGIEANCIAMFNSQNLLEISITEANCSKLLGRGFGDKVSVKFR